MKIVSKEAKFFAKNLGLVEKSMNFEKATSETINSCLKNFGMCISENSHSPKSSKSKLKTNRLRNPTLADHTNTSSIYEEDKISVTKLSAI
jgi:hypothetical protein